MSKQISKVTQGILSYSCRRAFIVLKGASPSFKLSSEKTTHPFITLLKYKWKPPTIGFNFLSMLDCLWCHVFSLTLAGTIFVCGIWQRKWTSSFHYTFIAIIFFHEENSLVIYGGRQPTNILLFPRRSDTCWWHGQEAPFFDEFFVISIFPSTSLWQRKMCILCVSSCLLLDFYFRGVKYCEHFKDHHIYPWYVIVHHEALVAWWQCLLEKHHYLIWKINSHSIQVIVVPRQSEYKINDWDLLP